MNILQGPTKKREKMGSDKRRENTSNRQQYNNKTTSQYGSHLREVWGDPDVGSLTSTDFRARREAESNRHIESCKDATFSPIKMT